MRMRTSAASEPRERSGALGPPRASVQGSPRGEAARIITAVAVMIGGGSSVLACPMCFGAEETSMVDGTKLGVLVMVVVTLAVQGGFLAFFLYLLKHAKRNAELELDSEWLALQGPSRRTS